MVHFFAEPERLKVALNIALTEAHWRSSPWYKGLGFDCDACGSEHRLVLVSTVNANQPTCEDWLQAELTRRGWMDNGQPLRADTRRDICPACVAASPNQQGRT